MAKPVVDGIERSLGDQAEVLRLSVTDNVRRELALRYGVRRLPTLVVLDGDGDVVLKQAGALKREEVLDVVAQLTGASPSNARVASHGATSSRHPER